MRGEGQRFAVRRGYRIAARSVLAKKNPLVFEDKPGEARRGKSAKRIPVSEADILFVNIEVIGRQRRDP